MLGYVIFTIHNLISRAMMWYAANHCLEPRFSRRATIALEAGGLVLCALVGCLSELLPHDIANHMFTVRALLLDGKSDKPCSTRCGWSKAPRRRAF